MRPEDVDAGLVEKAARHRFARHFAKYPEITWESTFENIRAKYLASAADYLAAVMPEIQAQALRDAAGEMEAEYEERTAKSGAYGQTKIRAALLMGAGMVRKRAARLTATTDYPGWYADGSGKPVLDPPTTEESTDD